MRQKYRVYLSEDERDYLANLIGVGTSAARRLHHARILLHADQGSGEPGWPDQRIAEAVEVSQPTISRVRKQYVEEGLEAALNRRALCREYQRKLDGSQEARLIALACSAPPAAPRGCHQGTSPLSRSGIDAPADWLVALGYPPRPPAAVATAAPLTRELPMAA